MHSPETGTTLSDSRLPLALPEELWAGLSPAQRAVYRRAEALLDVFSFEREVSLARLFSYGLRAEVLRALQVLGSMSLVDIDGNEDDANVTLRALPEEHVRVTGPDGRPRWVFVARPIEAPVVDRSKLN